MNEEGNKLLESLMGALGDNPSEAIGQMLSALSDSTADNKEEEVETNQKGEGGGFDPSMLLKLQGVIGNAGQTDERSTLLQALRPFLSEEKRPQIDRAIKLLQLSQLAKTAQDLNLFNHLL